MRSAVIAIPIQNTGLTPSTREDAQADRVSGTGRCTGKVRPYRLTMPDTN
jgi:hypothetical protein